MKNTLENLGHFHWGVLRVRASETHEGDQNSEDCSRLSSDLHRLFLMSIKSSNRTRNLKFTFVQRSIIYSRCVNNYTWSGRDAGLTKNDPNIMKPLNNNDAKT
ncbi:hypothetical protein E2C01_048296 [Portunus trituberculatus]|uniref:Uncharacterized protein n=1 Tax=Portunus trituberculatus TaxID=210409 RepID=A0A5B7GAG1_PORTR|nr:hypothetical protein [Portunus trituberculatus]